MNPGGGPGIKAISAIISTLMIVLLAVETLKHQVYLNVPVATATGGWTTVTGSLRIRVGTAFDAFNS